MAAEEFERVVLVNDDGEQVGTELKSAVHTSDTPLHLAFSCYLVNTEGKILVTRRSLAKRTWPGVWTNSFCGHPAPAESTEAAIVRRGQEELGAMVSNLRPALPRFRYRAVDASGVVENEICPVFVGELTGGLDPAASEVAEWEWVDPLHLSEAVRLAPFAFSPWMRDQLVEDALTRELTRVTAQTHPEVAS